MTDKNRIQRENAVAEALLGPGKTARNLMRLLISAYESGSGVELEIYPWMCESVDSYRFASRDIFATLPVPEPTPPHSPARPIAAQTGQPVPEFDAGQGEAE